jgi:hypothetical protein
MLGIIWLLFLVYRVAEEWMPQPFWFPRLVAILFLIVPLFKLISFLPLFGDIRAPESFCSVGGFCALVTAIALVLPSLFEQLLQQRLYRWPLLVVLVLFFVLEMFPVYSLFKTSS